MKKGLIIQLETGGVTFRDDPRWIVSKENNLSIHQSARETVYAAGFWKSLEEFWY